MILRDFSKIALFSYQNRYICKLKKKIIKRVFVNEINGEFFSQILKILAENS